MKFYYNGKKVRTSKTHIYTHGIIDTTGKVVSCHGSLGAAVKERDALGSYHRRHIKNSEDAINALEAGRGYYYYKQDRMAYKVSIKGKTVDEYRKQIKHSMAMLEVYSRYQIVELEASD
jgi:hypothetical protein